MKRRGNKSHKVPNVKLRPAQASSSSLVQSVEQCWVDETQARNEDTRYTDLCPRPFKGVVLCATGIPDKPALFKKALELGAATVSAFTDRVTHLVAISHGGAKYTCALERMIPIVTPEWIETNYETWLHGGDVDLVASVQLCRLPVFSGVVVCPSGIEDQSRRSQIHRLVQEHGGHYVSVLERPVRVTHLLCSGDKETEKMQHAEKFNARGEARIHLVWDEWFWDSLEFGGRFDETTYQVRRPRPERKTVDPSTPQAPDSAIPSQLSLQAAGAPQAVASEFDEFEDETAHVNLVPTVTLQVWGGLLERRGYEISEGEIVRSPTKSQPSSLEKAPQAPNLTRRGTTSVIAAVRSVNSFAPVEKEASTSIPQRPLPFKRASTSSLLSRSATPNYVPPPSLENIAGPSSEGAGPSSKAAAISLATPIFAGLNFCLLGEAKTPAVRSAIEQNGGKVVSGEGRGRDDVDFFIVRLLSGSKIYRHKADELSLAKYRTECWLENCIHEERLCGIDDHVSFKPLGVDIPIPGAENIHIGLSGLDQSESCHTRRLLRALGINLIPLFSRKATHLLCPSGTGLKFEKACEWGIPVVSNDWLGAIASSGVIPPVDNYLVSAPSNSKVDDRQPLHRLDRPPAPSNYNGKGKAVYRGDDGTTTSAINVKGKGKANAPADEYDAPMDVDLMRDVTNSASPELRSDQNLPEALVDPPPQSTLPPTTAPRQPASLSNVNSLERQSTTILAQDPPEGRLGGGLGRPTEMLGGSGGSNGSSFYVHPSSVQTLTHGSPLVQYGTRASSSIAHTIDGSMLARAGSSSSSSSSNSKKPEHPASLAARRTPSRRSSTMSLASNNGGNSNEDANNLMRVPSSKSPSPMKIAAARRMASMSPVKIDPGQAKALQESIASLLGKRQSPDEDGENEESNGGEASGAGGGAGRKGKRKRPQRTKAKPSMRAKPHSNRKSPPTSALGGAMADAVSLSFDPYGASAMVEQSQVEEQSIRVVYEDPAQAEERKRLMNMLKSVDGPDQGDQSGADGRGGSVGMRTRRSARVAGF